MTYILSEAQHQQLEDAATIAKHLAHGHFAYRAETEIDAALSLLAGLPKVPPLYSEPSTVYMPCKMHEHLSFTHTFTACAVPAIPVCPHCAAMKEPPQP